METGAIRIGDEHDDEKDSVEHGDRHLSERSLCLEPSGAFARFIRPFDASSVAAGTSLGRDFGNEIPKFRESRYREIPCCAVFQVAFCDRVVDTWARRRAPAQM